MSIKIFSVGLLFSTMLLVLSSCSSAQRASGTSSGYNLITKSEIDEAVQKRPIQNAHELIEFLRPRYLHARPQSSLTHGVMQSEPIVYLNNVRFGAASELYNINCEQIKEITYLKSSDATQRFGIGHEGGAIIISTR